MSVATYEEDPAVGPFLGLLAQDIEQHPERLRPLDANLRERVQALVGHIDVDLNEPLATADG
jgi:antitoxin PrlF